MRIIIQHMHFWQQIESKYIQYTINKRCWCTKRQTNMKQHHKIRMNIYHRNQNTHADKTKTKLMSWVCTSFQVTKKNKKNMYCIRGYSWGKEEPDHQLSSVTFFPNWTSKQADRETRTSHRMKSCSVQGRGTLAENKCTDEWTDRCMQRKPCTVQQHTLTYLQAGTILASETLWQETV